MKVFMFRSYGFTAEIDRQELAWLLIRFMAAAYFIKKLVEVAYRI